MWMWMYMYVHFLAKICQRHWYGQKLCRSFMALPRDTRLYDCLWSIQSSHTCVLVCLTFLKTCPSPLIYVTPISHFQKHAFFTSLCDSIQGSLIVCAACIFVGESFVCMYLFCAVCIFLRSMAILFTMIWPKWQAIIWNEKGFLTFVTLFLTI